MLRSLLPGRRPAGGLLAGPASLELERDCVRVGERWQRTFAVIGYPREVTRGWLAPLLRAAGDLDLTLHVEPITPEVASSNLQRQRARLESSRRIEADRGRLADPTIAAAAEDADELASRLARGESRLFRNALYLSITAPDRDELEARSERVRSLCASLMLHAVPATFRPLDGWLSSLPLGMDRLRAVLPRLGQLPLGGTAVGTGLNAPEGFAAEVIDLVAERTGLQLSEARDHFEAQGAQDVLVEASGACRVVAVSLNKLASDLRWMSSGPSAGLAEIHLPDLQPGSSIMPGKVNPVLPEATQQVVAQVIGNDAAVAFAREFTGYSKLAASFARSAVQRAGDLPVHEGLKVEADLSTLAYQTADAVEGMTAFIEKRKPQFQDR